MKNKILKALLFLAIVVCVLLAVITTSGDILVDKSLHRYYMLEKELERRNETYDVQVYGSCHAYTSFDSMFLVEGYDISCYNMSNPGEIVPATYLRMLDRFSYDVPKVVLLDAWGLNAYETYSSASDILGDYFANNLERVPFSLEKLEVISDFDTLDFLECNFNAIRYRNRLLEGSLSAVDFQYTFERHKETYGKNWLYDEMENRFLHKGYLLYPTIAQPTYTELQNQVESDDLLEIEPQLVKYLDKIIELCEANDVKLIIYRAPYVSAANELRKANWLESYLQEKQVTYYDLEKEIPFDPMVDFLDLYHLSATGAAKATQFLAQDVLAEFGIKYQAPSFEPEPEDPTIEEPVVEILPTVTLENGVLLLDETAETGIYIDNSDGKDYTFPDMNYRGTAQYIEIDPSEPYVLATFNEGYGVTFAYNAVIGAYYDGDGAFISGIYSPGDTQIGCHMSNGRRMMDIPEGAKYVRLCINDADDPQIAVLEISYNGSEYSEIMDLLDRSWDDAPDLEGTVIVNFGDSIFGNTENITSISNYISVKTGALVYNCGFGSGRMARYCDAWDPIAMCTVAECIANRDFTIMENAVETGWSGMPGYVPKTMDMLANQINFDWVDVITISYGTNDYIEPGARLNNPNDPFDVTTVCGALRYSVRALQTAYPSIKILVTTPVYRMLLDEETREVIATSDEKNWGSGTLTDYSLAIRQACEDMNVPCLDLQNVSQINWNTRTFYFDSHDGVHPNEAGRRQIAGLISGAVVDMIY